MYIPDVDCVVCGSAAYFCCFDFKQTYQTTLGFLNLRTSDSLCSYMVFWLAAVLPWLL